MYSFPPLIQMHRCSLTCLPEGVEGGVGGVGTPHPLTMWVKRILFIGKEAVRDDSFKYFVNDLAIKGSRREVVDAIKNEAETAHCHPSVCARNKKETLKIFSSPL